MAVKNQPDPLLGDGRFRLAFEHAPIGMALVTNDYRLNKVNAALCQALGYNEEELLSKRFIDITHPDDIRSDRQLADKLFRGEIPSYRLEKRFRTRDGQLVWLDLSAFTIRGDPDKPPYGLAMVENITDRKRTEEALRTSEERYRSFVINSSEAIWRYEIERPIAVGLPVDEQIEAMLKYGYLAECNDAMARLHGRERAEDLVGTYFCDMISISNPTNMASLRAFVNNGYRLHNTDSIVSNETGQSYFSSSVIGIVVNNYLLRVWGTQRDETAKRTAEWQIEESRQQLRQLAAHLQDLRERERANLAREMHDTLGHSLTSLKLDFTRLAKRLANPLDEPTRLDILDRLGSAAELLDETIALVKTISTELRPGVLDKFGLAAAAEWQCQEFENRTGIKCYYRLPIADGRLPAEISIALFRILQEALTNVARHSEAREVTVTLNTDGTDVILSVRDNGKGISPARIAAPTSLGLLGMRERTEMLGGQFTIEGKPGRTILNARIPIDAN